MTSLIIPAILLASLPILALIADYFGTTKTGKDFIKYLSKN